MADVTKINGYIIKDANAPHPSNAGSAGQVLKKTETGTEWADASVPDWNQNDSTAADYVKNRPFYTGDPVETVLVEESTVAFTLDEQSGLYMAYFPSTFEATIGKTYKISWDGTIYECVCASFQSRLVIGNLSIAGVGSDTSEPFLMGIANGQVIQIGTADTSSSHTFSISGTDVPVVKIDPKYLPVSKPDGKSYLTFSSLSSFTLAVGDATKHWNGTLEYFSSNRTWTTWDGTTTLSSIDNYGEYVLYLRGTGNTVITGNSQNYRWILTGSNIACIGNIENLLDYATVEAGGHPTMAGHCYDRMFYGCTGLTQAPALPATTLENYCYNNMFDGCTSLTQAPALPATTLANECYANMFDGCTSLTQAPALPATTLANYCYAEMFWGCTSLTQAPTLPATTLAGHCYDSMFYGCTSLTQAPTLPATTLANYCYYRMFYGCTSLTQAPTLPATTLANYCYNNMFSDCTGLKLSSTQTDEYTQEYRIPSSGTGTSATNALGDMFASTGGTFTGTPEINITYYLSSDNMIVRDTEITTLNGYVGSMIDTATKSKIDVNMKGAANGVASLGADGKVPSAQLPEMGGEAYTATLTTSGWAQSGSRYAQTVNVAGVTASTPVVLVDVALSGTDIDADAAALEAWGIVSANNVAQGNGTLTFYALSVPSVNVPVNVGVC